MLNYLAFYTGLFLISWVLTYFLYRYAKSLQLIAAADERSSHKGDTATGGGLALAISFLLVAWLGCKYQFISYDLFIAIAGGGGCSR